MSETAERLLDKWVKKYSACQNWEEYTDVVSHTINDLSKADFEDFAEFCAKKLQEEMKER